MASTTGFITKGGIEWEESREHDLETCTLSEQRPLPWSLLPWQGCHGRGANGSAFHCVPELAKLRGEGYSRLRLAHSLGRSMKWGSYFGYQPDTTVTMGIWRVPIGREVERKRLLEAICGKDQREDYYQHWLAPKPPTHSK